MNSTADEIEKLKIHTIENLLEYIPNAILTKTILKKATGNVTLSVLDAGQELDEKTTPFDIFVQVIHGEAQIAIKDKEFKLEMGEGIVIPAHALHSFNADQPFKMISTTIKSGYED